MAVFNYAGGEINIKIVYYGPGLSGKTTNLEHMYSKLPRESKGKMVSMKTRTDRTLFFDFLPIEVGDLNGMKLRFLLYTVPGQVYYNATRKLVLKGVDALVFVADSSAERMDENRESLDNLEENLNELGMTLDKIPWVMQFNKRDLPDRLPVDEMEKMLNSWGATVYEAVATNGKGVYETFEGIASLVFRKLKSEFKEAAGREQEDSGDPAEEPINVEIVAQGKQRKINSEAEESKSLGYAEEREEEHESVSEFVDNVLTEHQGGAEIDMASDREGYEEYGHVVELGGESTAQGEAVGPRHETESVSTQVKEKDEEKVEFINDPLDKLSVEPETGEGMEEGSVESGSREMPREKTINVPVVISEDEIRDNIQVKVVLDINVV